MIRSRLELVAVLPILLLLVTGCGNERKLPDRLQVTGSITFDGKPLEKGTITFQSPEDVAIGLALNADIVDGQYTIKITPGPKNVQINSFVKDPVTEFRDIIPIRYNRETTLQATVSNESKEFDFSLEK